VLAPTIVLETVIAITPLVSASPDLLERTALSELAPMIAPIGVSASTGPANATQLSLDSIAP